MKSYFVITRCDEFKVKIKKFVDVCHHEVFLSQYISLSQRRYQIAHKGLLFIPKKFKLAKEINSSEGITKVVYAQEIKMN